MELLPCPMCGSAAAVNYVSLPFGEPMQADSSMALVTCSDVTCIRQSGYQSTLAAIAAWNRRATPDPLLDASLRMRERLKPDANGLVPVRKGDEG